MLFSWLKRRARGRIARAGLADGLRDQLPAALWQYERLTADQQTRVRETSAILMHEKNWEGCGGLAMTDEVRLTVAAQAALVTLGLQGEYFDRVLSVLVYPRAYVAPQQQAAGGGVVFEQESTRLGEAWHRGPVIVSWRDAELAGRSKNAGRSIVAHEFSHQLDMLNGRSADGVPPLGKRLDAEAWRRVLDGALARLRRDHRRRTDPLVDRYGATDRSEFFAVVSEMFFQWPDRIAQREPDLYAALRAYYRVDACGWGDGAG